MSKKAGVVIGTVLAVIVAVAVGFVALTGGKDEAYRSIMVYQVNGNATITRASVGEMEAYENLMLQSGDSVAVASESSMRLKLDDDKYLLAEQDTRMDIVAEGDGENAKTRIDLKQGSVTSEIQNKLGQNASYEVNTPNSVMAVRGTIFRVETGKNESGDVDTKLTVFAGKVSVKTVSSDGTVSDEEVMVEAGQELHVGGTETSAADLGDPADIDYESLPPVMQEYIKELGIDTADSAQEIGQIVKIEETGEQGQQDVEDRPEADEQDQAENPPETQPKKSENQQRQQPSEKRDEETVQEPEQGLEAQEEMQSETQQETQPQEETQPPKPQPQSQPQASEPDKDSSSGGEPEDGGRKKTQYYTVTFQYNGSTFGTQKVKKGEKATEPKLSPTENGAWDYDFSTKVNKNLTVQWIEK